MKKEDRVLSEKSRLKKEEEWAVEGCRESMHVERKEDRLT
jgi:hypothetical protein